jgi:hypothetical protein
MKMFIISMSGCRGKNKEFVLKEISLVGVDNDGNEVSKSFLVKPPYPEDDLPDGVLETNKWMRRNSPNGGFKWDDGEIEYSDWQEQVQQTCDTIPDAEVCAKGSEQVKILSFLTGHGVVLDLNDKRCPTIDTLLCRYKDQPVKSCGRTSHGPTNCTLNKCFLYMKWIEQERIEEEKIQHEREELLKRLERLNKQRVEQEKKQYELMEHSGPLRICHTLGGGVVVILQFTSSSSSNSSCSCSGVEWWI